MGLGAYQYSRTSAATPEARARRGRETEDFHIVEGGEDGESEEGGDVLGGDFEDDLRDGGDIGKRFVVRAAECSGCKVGPLPRTFGNLISGETCKNFI